ncbi:MAG: hypothetical protein ACK5Z5_00585 [Neisseriaceae bacterium]
MNILFLHVVTGKQSGSFIELSPGNSYIISSDYQEADIYLDTDTKFNLKLSVDIDQVNFNDYIGNISLKSGTIELNRPYQMPLALNIDGVWVIFSQDEEITPLQIDELILTPDKASDPVLDSADLEYAIANPDLTADADKIDEFNSQINATQNLKITLYKYWDKFLRYSNIAFKKSLQYWKIFNQKFGIWSYIITGSVLVLLLAFIIIIYQFRSQSISDNNQLNSIYIEQSIKEELAKLPKKYANLKCSKAENKFLISGIVVGNYDSGELSSHFKPWLPRIKFQVLEFDTVKKNILKILADNQVVVPKVGFNDNLDTISVSGIIGNGKSFDDIAIAISNQYPMLGDMDTSKIYLASDIDSQIDNLVKSITNQIDIQKDYTKGIINFNGYLTTDQQIQVESKIAIFNKVHSGVVKIASNFQNILKALPFAINEVYTGNTPWLATDDGVKLYLGGTYKGITLLSIDKDKITFKGKSTFVILLNQLLSSDLGSQSVVAADSGCCDRVSILRQEYTKKLKVISDEQKQLKDLQKILSATKDVELKKSLNNTINNLTQDLEFRKKELAYYQGGKQ